MLRNLAVPANNERGPRYTEKALAAIHQALDERQTITLEYGTHQGRVGLFLRYAPELDETVCSPLIANYPQCALTVVEREDESPAGWSTWSMELDLVPELFPILRHTQFEDLLNGSFADPIDGLLRATKPDETLRSRIEITARPAGHGRRKRAVHAVRILSRDFFRRNPHLSHFYARHATRSRVRPLVRLFGLMARDTDESARSHVLETTTSRHHEREEDLQAASDKMGCHLFEVSVRLIAEAPAESADKAVERLRIMAGAFGAFTRSRLAVFHTARILRGQAQGLHVGGWLLSHEELSTLWHPPCSTVGAERLQTSDFTELEAPAFLPSGTGEGEALLGRVRFRDDSRLFGMSQDSRRKHIYVVGKSGMGKSNLLLNLVHTDLQSEHRGVCLVDPHGDLATAVLRSMPKHRTNDVIYLDAGDGEYAVPFNPLFCRDPTRVDQVTSGIVSAFKKLHDSWGPRLEDTLRNAAFAIVEQGGTMLSLLQLLSDGNYRDRIVPKIQDEIVRSFWIHEFASWSEQYRTEAVAAIQNKVRPFLTNRNIRAIVTQSGRSIDLREIMDTGKVLIVNLAKGRVGEDNSTLLGSFLVTALQQAAMARAELPEDERADFNLVIDEFHNFSTSSFATVLSEGRKFRLNIVLAHQYLQQIDPKTTNAVFGNVGTIITFAVGSDDAAVLAEQLSKFPGQVEPHFLTSLPRYTACVRVLVDGMATNPFSMVTLPPKPAVDDRTGIVIQQSRRQHSQTATRFRK